MTLELQKVWWDLGRVRVALKPFFPLEKAENKLCSEGEGWL